MAIASVGSLSAPVSSTSSNTLQATGVTAAVNSLLVYVITADNRTTSSGDNSEVASVIDSAGNTWVKAGEITNADSIANGIVTSVWYAKITSALSSGTVTATFNVNRTDKSGHIWQFTMASNMVPQLDAVTANEGDATNDFGSLTLSGLPSVSRLWFRALGKEVNTTTSVTATSGYTQIPTTRSRNAATAVISAGEFIVTTATSQTSNPTLAVSGDYASVFFAISEQPPVDPITNRPIWKKSSVSGNWYDVASSADGSKLAAVPVSGYIYTSTDSGATWTERTSSGSRSWYSIASSADGTKLAAVSYFGYIYTSTDSGVTWTEQTGSGATQWKYIASSSDGSKLAAIVDTVYTSTDSGVTWTQQVGSGSRNWALIASSADGSKLVAVPVSGYIYTSTDSGVTWTEQTGAGSRGWGGIASSADGTKLAATVNNGYIYTSTDSGVTWTQQVGSGSRQWKNITSSADGTKLAAIVNNSYIYVSTDSGVTWDFQFSAGSRLWSNIASSSDGSKLAAVTTGEYIYASDVTNTGTHLTFSGTATGLLKAQFTGSSAFAFTLSGTGSRFGIINIEASSGISFTSSSTMFGAISGVASSILSYSNSATLIANGEIENVIVPEWTQRTNSGSRGWEVIASSIDGTKLAAAVYGGYIYTSTDSGATWTEQTNSGIRNWYCISSSADGSKLFGGVGNGYIYTSDDFGVTWTERTSAGQREWYSIASSADGSKLVAITNVYIYTSTDSGTTWVEQTSAGTMGWYGGVASSYDGVNLAATTGAGYVYTSTDSGVTWIGQVASGSRNWQSITSSSDGTKLAVAVYGGYIYTSRDSGFTWTEQTGAGSRNWFYIDSSADGSKIAAVEPGGSMYVSSDFGATWTEQTDLGTGGWNSVTVSADGSKIAVSTSSGYIHTYNSQPYSMAFMAEASGISVAFITNKIDGWVVENHPYETFNDLMAASGDGTKLVRINTNNVVDVSLDGGYTWSPTSLTLTQFTNGIHVSEDGTKIFILEYTDDGIIIHRSFDWGTTWTTNSVIGGGGWYLTGSADGSILVTVDDWNTGYPVISTDYGATWSTIVNDDVAWWYPFFVSGDGTKLAALVGTTLYTSTDNGATWTSNSLPATALYSQSLTLTYDGSKIFCTWQDGIDNFVSFTTDDGATWTTYPVSYLNNGIWSSSDGARLVSRGYDRLTVSKDDGSTWSTLRIENFEISLPDFSRPYFVNDTEILYNWDGTLEKSTDDLTDYDVIAGNPSILLSRGFGGTAYSYDKSKVFNSADNLFYRTFDGGLNWEKIQTTGNKLASNEDSTTLVKADGYIYTSTDFGSTWTEQTNSGSKNWASICVSADGNKIFAVVQNALDCIYYSTDGGATWDVAKDSGGFAVVRTWKDVKCSADGNIVVASSSSGICISTDAGTTWAQTSIFSNVNELVMSLNGQYIVGRDGSDGNAVYSSDDSGSTWTSNFLTFIPGAMSISDDGSMLISDNTGSKKVSYDNGATWSDIATSLNRAINIIYDFNSFRSLYQDASFEDFDYVTEDTKFTFSDVSQALGKGDISSSISVTFDGEANIDGEGLLGSDQSVTFLQSSTVAGFGDIAGSSSLAFETTLDLTKGSAAFSFEASAAIYGVAAAESLVNTSFLASGTAIATGYAIASSLVEFNSATTLEAIGYLESSTGIAFEGSLNAVTAETSVAFSAVAELLAVGNIGSETAFTFDVHGVQTGTGSLGGSSFPLFPADAVLLAVGALISSENTVEFSTYADAQIYVPIESVSSVSFAAEGSVVNSALIANEISTTFIVSDTAIDASGMLRANSNLAFEETSSIEAFGYVESNASIVFEASLDTAVAESFVTFNTYAELFGVGSTAATSVVEFNAHGVQTGEGSLAAASFPLFPSDATLLADGELNSVSCTLEFVSDANAQAYVPVEALSTVEFTVSGDAVSSALLSDTYVSFTVDDSTSTAVGRLHGDSELSFTDASSIKAVGYAAATSSIEFNGNILASLGGAASLVLNSSATISGIVNISSSVLAEFSVDSVDISAVGYVSSADEVTFDSSAIAVGLASLSGLVTLTFTESAILMFPVFGTTNVRFTVGDVVLGATTPVQAHENFNFAATASIKTYNLKEEFVGAVFGNIVDNDKRFTVSNIKHSSTTIRPGASSSNGFTVKPIIR